ncbi:class I SAM-dependent methyltransferase [Virgibacillus flavescens]|uniref:class I SAM-dependent methyltransferase n=1 Tax=Virgibacillus flavescens TaxID=1611422 RepID=UPI003D3365C8
MTYFNWNKEAELQWDSRAQFWNERSVNMWDNGSRKDIVPFIEKHLKKGSKVYDIGCGDGYGTYKLQQAGYDVIGMDLSSEMVNLAKERAKDISFVQGDVMDLPFENNSCDGVVSINVLEWTEIPATALKQLSRVLKKDGLLCVGILGPTAGPRTHSFPRVYGDKAIANTMMPWEFQKLATENGFTYVNGFGVYRDGVKASNHEGLPIELKQALTFLWVFILRKEGE